MKKNSLNQAAKVETYLELSRSCGEKYRKTVSLLAF